MGEGLYLSYLPLLSKPLFGLLFLCGAQQMRTFEPRHGPEWPSTLQRYQRNLLSIRYSVLRNVYRDYVGTFKVYSTEGDVSALSIPFTVPSDTKRFTISSEATNDRLLLDVIH